MYKVFFNERTVYVGTDFSNGAEENGVHIHTFKNRPDLYEILTQFTSSEKIEKLYLIGHDLTHLMTEVKAFFRNIEAGGGLVLDGSGKFLIILRNGIWDLPKGKMEKGENHKKTALREVKEETGLHGLKIVQPLMSTFHIYQISDQWVLKRTQWFEMLYTGKKKPELESKEGISDYKWVKPGEAEFIERNSYGSILELLRFRKMI